MTEPPSDADKQRHVWTIGDYPAVARHLHRISVTTVEQLGLQGGERVLDVGVGDGNAALEAARLGASVVGVDLTPAQVERARTRIAASGSDVEVRVGDAQELDLPDDSFDVVMSVLGVIFAPDWKAALGEMARVCRPGGRVAVAAWTGGGWMVRWRSMAAHLLPTTPPGTPSPDDWGDPDELGRRFEAVGLDPSIARHDFWWTDTSVEEAADFLLANSGPFIAFRELMVAQGTAAEAREDLVRALHAANEATDGTCRLPSPYLLAVGRR